jgi:hypothetical protein
MELSLSTKFKALMLMAVVIAVPASADSLIAVEVFNYTGTCTDCTFSTGTLELLAGYTPGSPLSTSPFVNFSYSSNLLNFTITQNDAGFFDSGGLPSTLPGAATLVIENNLWEFSSSSSGSWFVENLSSIPQDFGPANSWSQASVPEPGALAMLGIGLAALAGVKARYRRGRGY